MASVMVSVGAGDRGRAVELSEWLRTQAPHRDDPEARGCGSLREVTGRDSQWGGGKYPECDVWAGVLNHADLEAVLDRVRAVEWHAPNEFQLFLMDQEQSFFRLWMFRDGDLRQFAPTSPNEEDPEFFPPEPFAR
ncbi:hypothetical protein [Actinokineospora sp. NBRC 105648]|uniref:hypothetical protein n=1 Tax=Actinokineospora sp. NBRC 105648 TaxID=3032206 RepID=UPI0025533D94|nr:hypothetical protein [Actinokineospora sp. NBRC 105648]